jgi:DNA-binding MarR family transcriptional regulator
MTKHVPGRSSSQRGYVEQTADPADGRARLVRLTDAGRDLVRAALEAIDSIEGDWTTS